MHSGAAGPDGKAKHTSEQIGDQVLVNMLRKHSAATRFDDLRKEFAEQRVTPGTFTRVFVCYAVRKKLVEVAHREMVDSSKKLKPEDFASLYRRDLELCEKLTEEMCDRKGNRANAAVTLRYVPFVLTTEGIAMARGLDPSADEA